MTSHAMGSDVGQSPSLVNKYCKAVKRGSKLPMLAKMTPNIGDMNEVALAALEGGADGIAAINTVNLFAMLILKIMLAFQWLMENRLFQVIQVRLLNRLHCALLLKCIMMKSLRV